MAKAVSLLKSVSLGETTEQIRIQLQNKDGEGYSKFEAEHPSQLQDATQILLQDWNNASSDFSRSKGKADAIIHSILTSSIGSISSTNKIATDIVRILETDGDCAF